MSVSYQFGEIASCGATRSALGASLEAEHRAGVRDVPSAGDLWNGVGPVARRHPPRGPLEQGPNAR